MKNIFEQLPSPACSELQLDRGECVFRQEDKSRGMFYVISGTIQLQRHTRAGAIAVIHNARAGETFAEASLFFDAYHCDAVAGEASRIICADRNALLELFSTDPDFAMTVTKRFAIQIQSYRRKLELLAISNARERVFTALVEGLMTSDIKTFATEIGLTHETVYRALSSLVKSRRVKKTGRGVYLCLGQ